MYIGLVRHFKVDGNAQAFMTYDDFEKWVIEYDNSHIIEKEFEISSYVLVYSRKNGLEF